VVADRDSLENIVMNLVVFNALNSRLPAGLVELRRKKTSVCHHASSITGMGMHPITFRTYILRDRFLAEADGSSKRKYQGGGAIDCVPCRW